MTLPAFKTLNPVGDYSLQTVENNVAASLARVLPVLLLDYVLVSATLAANTPLALAHKLGRQPQGWFAIDIDANATLSRVSWSTTLLTLNASADCSATLWVF